MNITPTQNKTKQNKTTNVHYKDIKTEIETNKVNRSKIKHIIK